MDAGNVFEQRERVESQRISMQVNEVSGHKEASDRKVKCSLKPTTNVRDEQTSSRSSQGA